LDFKSILRVTVSASDIAPCKPDKDLALTNPWALALNRTEYLAKSGMLHAIIVQNIFLNCKDIIPKFSSVSQMNIRNRRKT
jgi:hypothetical protein